MTNAVPTPDGRGALARLKSQARLGASAMDPRDLAYRYAILIAWALVIVIFGALRPNTFLTASNFQTIFGTQAVLLVLTLGLLFPSLPENSIFRSAAQSDSRPCSPPC